MASYRAGSYIPPPCAAFAAPFHQDTPRWCTNHIRKHCSRSAPFLASTAQKMLCQGGTLALLASIQEKSSSSIRGYHTNMEVVFSSRYTRRNSSLLPVPVFHFAKKLQQQGSHKSTWRILFGLSMHSLHQQLVSASLAITAAKSQPQTLLTFRCLNISDFS